MKCIKFLICWLSQKLHFPLSLSLSFFVSVSVSLSLTVSVPVSSLCSIALEWVSWAKSSEDMMSLCKSCLLVILHISRRLGEEEEGRGEGEREGKWHNLNFTDYIMYIVWHYVHIHCIYCALLSLNYLFLGGVRSDKMYSY